MNRELLARLLSIAVELGELRFSRDVTEEICGRLVELAGTLDRQELDALSDELQEILADEGAAQERLLRGAIH
jgi:hypothetical protein